MKILNNIYEYCLCKGIATIKNNEGIIVLNNEENLNNKNYAYLHCSNEFVIITDEENKPFIYYNSRNIDESIYDIFQISRLINNYLIFYTKNNTRKTGVYDLNKRQIVIENLFDIRNVNIFGNILLTGFKTFLECRDIITGNFLWQY